MSGSLRRGHSAAAAFCYERAGLPAQAARCHEAAGDPAQAARCYEAAGTASALADAARCYEAVGGAADAARCYDRLGRWEQAAEQWRAAGDAIGAGWALLRAGRTPARTRALLDRAAGPTAAARLRRALGLALLDRAETSAAGLVAEAAALLGQVPPDGGEPLMLERDAVYAADRIGRPDLAAEVLAGSARAGRAGAADRLRARRNAGFAALSMMRESTVPENAVPGPAVFDRAVLDHAVAGHAVPGPGVFEHAVPDHLVVEHDRQPDGSPSR